MWLAVIIGVCLAVEVLTYLTGGEISMNKKNAESEVKQERPVECQASRNIAA
jgi:anthranilate/para-aminobenzoate synthase component II